MTGAEPGPANLAVHSFVSLGTEEVSRAVAAPATDAVTVAITKTDNTNTALGHRRIATPAPEFAFVWPTPQSPPSDTFCRCDANVNVVTTRILGEVGSTQPVAGQSERRIEPCTSGSDVSFIDPPNKTHP